MTTHLSATSRPLQPQITQKMIGHIDRHLSSWCPLDVSWIIISYLQSAVPFPAACSCELSDRIQLEKRFLAFYHHCELFSSSSGDRCLKGRKTEVYTLNLVSQNLVYREKEKGPFRITNIFIETWVKSKRVLFEGAVYEDVTSNAQKWTFKLERRTGPEKAIYCLEKEKCIPLDAIPYIFLNGNEFECHTLPKQSGGHDESIKDKTWDHWKEEMGPGVGELRSVLFPLFAQAMSHICSVFSEPAVLEPGGCDGDLGFFLLDHYPKIKSYTIIEKSDPLSHLADNRSKCDCLFLSKNRKKLKAIHGDLRTLDIFEATGKRQSDVIILSGVVAENVLSESDSLQLVKNCKRSLKDRGFLLVAAYSAHHFGADDYKSMGFTVLNKSFSFVENTVFRLIPFYVLQKSSL